jgi:hypothetical protein
MGSIRKFRILPLFQIEIKFMAKPITKTMAFDDSAPTGETMADPAQPTPPDQEPDMGEPGEAAEGESLSLDVFGGKEPAVGDMVTLKVTAVDPENGTVSVMLPAAKKMGGIDAKAAMMDEENQASITA